MSKLPEWANIAIVSFDQNFGYAIETISVDSQNCTLSGAWDFETLEEPSILSILNHRLLVTSGIGNVQEIENRFLCKQVNLQSFISDAFESAREGVERFNSYIEEEAEKYSEYMSIPPAERKLLPKVVKRKLEPIYQHSWEISFDELKPEITLRQLGKRDSIAGTPVNMKRLIATAWLIKHFVDRWREDEVERISRSYLYPEGRDFQILPSSWINSAVELQRSVSS